MSEVGSAFVSVLPSARGFGKSLDAQTSAQVAASGKKSGGVWGKAFAIGAALIVAKKTVDFLGNTISAASNLNESLNAVNVTYGKQAGAVKNLGREAAAALGLSRVEFNDLSVRFANFAETVAGGDGKKVISTLDDLTTRAADFASVMNLDVAEAATLFQSGLAGESEPLRKFGIDLSAASVEAFAYANGITKVGEKLTEGEKVQARYGALMKQTTKTAGDFANTSGGLANSQRILSARFENVKATIGKVLIPALTAVVTFLSDTVIPGVETFVGEVKDLFKKVKQPVKDFFDAVTGSEAFATAVDLMADAAGRLKDGFKGAAKALAGIDFSNLDSEKVGQFIGEAIAKGLDAIVSLAGTLTSTLGKLFAKVDWVGLGIAMGKQVPALLTGLAVGILAFDPAPLLQGLADHWGDVLIAVLAIAFAPVRLAGALGTILAKIPFVGKFLERAVLWLNEAGQKFLGMLGRFFGRVWERVVAEVKFPGAGLVTKIVGAIKGLPGALKRFFDDLGARISLYAEAAFRWIEKGIARALITVLNFVKGIPGKILSAIGDLARLLFPKGSAVIEGLWNGLRSKVGEVFAWLKALPGRAVIAVGNVSQLLVGKGVALVAGFAKGMLSKLQDVYNAAKAIADKIADLFPSSPVKEGPLKSWNDGGAGKALMGLLAKGITDGGEAVKEALKKVVDAMKAEIDTLLSKLSSLKSEMASLADSVASAFTSDVFGGGVRDLIGGLSGDVSNLQALAAAFKKLVEMGVSPAFLSALFMSGNTSLILALANDPWAAQTASQLFGERANLASDLGGAVGLNQFGEKIDGVKDEIKELRKDIKVLAKEVREGTEKGAYRGVRDGIEGRDSRLAAVSR